MKTLVLIRHGKSSWDDPALSDFNRPLAPRGFRQAKEIFQEQHAQLSDVEVILCSNALRTKQTHEIFKSECGLANARTSILDGLYLPDTNEILNVVRATENSVNNVALVGHEPSLSQFLVQMGISPPIKFVTASICILHVETEQWSALSRQSVRRAVYFSRHHKAGFELLQGLPSRHEP